MSAELTASSLLTGTEVYRGVDAVEKNTASVMQIYNSIKTSYGPLGLDKMCIDASGSVSITNDGATMLKNMLVEDPAARLLVNLALEQDKEVGDGTTSVVLFAANLIMNGARLIRDGVHPSVVASGYRMAFNESVRYIKQKMSTKLDKALEEAYFGGDSAGRTNIFGAIVETSMSSKIINEEAALFAGIVKSALRNSLVDGKYAVERVSVLKSIGGSLGESEFFNGFILNCSVASRLMPRELASPRIACLGFSLLRDKLPLTVSIQVTDPGKIEEIRQKETEMTKNKCLAIIESGATLVLTTGGIDEMCVKMFTDRGIVAVGRCARDDLRAIARATGTGVRDSLVDEDNEYRLGGLGSCGRFELKSFADCSLVYLSDCPERLSTVLIRAPSSQIADEAQRALNDALQVLQRTLGSRSVVPGGGAAEAALSLMLEDFAAKINCREHIAIHRFSEALLELPRVLATNAGLDANAVVGELLKKQHRIYESNVFNKFLGIDVMSGLVQDNLERGIVEPTIYKLKILKAATEAAIGILRINEIVVFGKD